MMNMAVNIETINIDRELKMLEAIRKKFGEFSIKKVIFNEPATIVYWADGTKTVVKAQPGEVYDREKGFAMAISKKALGNKGNYCEIFKKWKAVEESRETNVPKM